MAQRDCPKSLSKWHDAAFNDGFTPAAETADHTGPCTGSNHALDVLEAVQGADEAIHVPIPTEMKRPRKFLRRVHTRPSSRMGAKVAPITTDDDRRSKSMKVKIRVRRKKNVPKIGADVVAALGAGSASGGCRVGTRRVSRLSQAIASRRQRAIQKRDG